MTDDQLTFRQARNRLKQRFGTGDGEILAWVLSDDLPALLDDGREPRLVTGGELYQLLADAALGLGVPERENLAELKEAFLFKPKDIEDFQPEDRFLTFEQAVARLDASATDGDSRTGLACWVTRGGAGPGTPLEAVVLDFSREVETLVEEAGDLVLISRSELDKIIRTDFEVEPGGTGEEREDHPLAVFRAMDKLTWKEITIKWELDKSQLQVEARDIPRWVSLEQLGLVRKDDGRLNRGGRMLEQFALMAELSKEDDGAETAREELSRQLRKAFRLKGSPFRQWGQGGGPKFRLEIPSDKAGRGGTVSLDREVADPTLSPEEQHASFEEWNRKIRNNQDPEYPIDDSLDD